MTVRGKPTAKEKSTNQLIANRANEFGLTRDDALEQYLINGILARLGLSAESKNFILKGGVLVSNLVNEPFRFTRDIDLHRTKAPPNPDHIRESFKTVVAIKRDDGITFGAVTAKAAEHETDGYDGVTVHIEAGVGLAWRKMKLDIGFGDAVVPKAKKRTLRPFLPDDPPPTLKTYPEEAVIAEKVESILKRTPDLEHRMKDLLDVVSLAGQRSFAGQQLVSSLTATFKNRGLKVDFAALDEMPKEVGARKPKQSEWAKMQKDKNVRKAIDLPNAVACFLLFVRPLLDAMAGNAETPTHWPAGGPWDAQDESGGS
jgi:predicted nucleotidyltransferase component of viral defense system